MTDDSIGKDGRRRFLRSVAGSAGAVAAMSAFPPAIERALATPAARRTGTIRDVEHIVVLMQENRSFDHYFGTMNGVRGFADRFPIPVRNAPGIERANVWLQPQMPVAPTLPAGQKPPLVTAPELGAAWPLPGTDIKPIAPFHLNTMTNWELMRVEGTPHSWWDAQFAWDHGRMNWWPKDKANHSMGYFTESDMPFQWAMANAFTLCDAYHCSFHGGTNTNRLFMWTGTNDPLAKGNGPATYNDYDDFPADKGDGGYTWITYTERLQQAGVSWQVYQNMEDNFTDNPLAGFQSFRAAYAKKSGASDALRERGVATRDLDLLREDVLNNRLPQISFIVATAEGSEHPGPSSPAQGAHYTSRVLDALTANPEVWARTVLFINFDENDGFFDHLPPPAVPSAVARDKKGKLVHAGASTVDTKGEYHEHLVWYHSDAREYSLLHRPYGLGPRVPMYVLSPWSKGGWVSSETFDHTSVIRFCEKRFGVMEPNISEWRRAVCGDLSSTMNFADPDDAAFFAKLPATLETARRAAALPKRTMPATPARVELPKQAAGVRPSRALPYELWVDARVGKPAAIGNAQGVRKWSETAEFPDWGDSNDDAQGDARGQGEGLVQLMFRNRGRQATVFHVYDRLNLDAPPRRYTVGPKKRLIDRWAANKDGLLYDLWVLGPNGFHRHFTGSVNEAARPEISVGYDTANRSLVLRLMNDSAQPMALQVRPNAYFDPRIANAQSVPSRSESVLRFDLSTSSMWYDFSVTVDGLAGFSRRVAGRMETGEHLVSDPAMEGAAIAQQWKV